MHGNVYRAALRRHELLGLALGQWSLCVGEVGAQSAARAAQSARLASAGRGVVDGVVFIVLMALA